MSPGIVITTPAAAFNLTMPAGATLETLVQWAAVDQAFDFTVTTTAAFAVTLVVNTGVTATATGSLVVAANSSGRFRLRRTAASTFIMYRIS